MFTLFGLGIGVAYGYSVVALFLPSIFPPSFRGEGGVVDVYFEAAAVNGTGSMVMKTERIGSGTLLAQIVRMVGEAQRSRAPIQKLADVVAGYFVAAVLTFIVWKGAAFGVLFKNAEAIEIMRKVDTRVVDETGTLTEGKPKVVAIVSATESDAALLKLAASLEQGSERRSHQGDDRSQCLRRAR